MADSPQDSDATQSAFHVAFRAELYAILDALPVPRRGRLLDVPCGDGFYSRRLAERLDADTRAMFEAAMKDFPAGSVTPRRVTTPITPP